MRPQKRENAKRKRDPIKAALGLWVPGWIGFSSNAEAVPMVHGPRSTVHGPRSMQRNGLAVGVGAA